MDYIDKKNAEIKKKDDFPLTESTSLVSVNWITRIFYKIIYIGLVYFMFYTNIFLIISFFI